MAAVAPIAESHFDQETDDSDDSDDFDDELTSSTSKSKSASVNLSCTSASTLFFILAISCLFI